ncbi:MAG: MFS transporter [Actinomycetota bacterium]|nr:MFS transporter [Actinomycetota bacterium]
MQVDARRTRIAVAAAFAAQGLGFAVLLSHVPAFKERYDIEDGIVTAVLFGVAVLAGVGTVLAERVAGRRGSGLVLRVALATVGLAIAVIAVAPDLPVFFLGFAIYGVAVGGVDASQNMQAVALQHRYGRSILTSFHAAWSAGGIAGALYTAGTEGLDLSLVLVLLAAAALVLAIAAVAGGRLAPITSVRPEPDVALDRAVAPAPWRPILLLGTAVVCFYVADSGTSTWSADYLHEVLHTSKGVAALALAAYLGASLVSRLVGDHAVRRIGGPAVVRTGGLGGASGLLLVVVAQQPVVAIAGFAVLGLGIGVIAPLSFAAAGELSPGAADTVVAQLNVFNYVGVIVGGAVVGLFGSAGVLRAGFVVPLLLTLAIVALAPAFHPRPVAETPATALELDGGR